MAIFAVAASPINACACSHHETQAVEKDSHQNSCGHGSATSDQPDEASENADSGDHCKSGADCTCVPSTQTTTSSSETTKVKIHAAALLPNQEKVEIVVPVYFSAPFAPRITVPYYGHIDRSQSNRGPPVS